jgi:hypothetical protein
MPLNTYRISCLFVAAALSTSTSLMAQAPATPPPPAAPAAADQPAAAPAAPAAPTWSVGPMDISGYIDAYYSFNANRPTNYANGQVNDLYNFNDKTDQFNLSGAKLTINHDPDPVGAHVDFLYGRSNTIINNAATNGSSSDQLNYIEQAFLSLKPTKAKGFELDLGKFSTSAGAEVIEAKDDWSYSRGLLFAWAIPYFHFGARASLPVSKTETIGVQVVNGWNNVSKANGGATVGFTSAFVKPKYTWNVNYYVGPENANTASGFRNLIDTTLLLTPNSKFNAYINYDYGHQQDATHTIDTGDGTITTGDNNASTWQGVAVALHEMTKGKSSFTERYEYFDDSDGFSTGTAQHVQEVTGTYEYKWLEGLLTRVEYRGDFSNVEFFHKDDTQMVKNQQTVTVAFIAFFGPKR